MTVSVTTWNASEGIVVGPLFFFTLVFVATIGGTVHPTVYVPMPYQLKTPAGTPPISAFNITTGNLLVTTMQQGASPALQVQNNAYATWASGSCTIAIQGYYRIA